MGTINYKGRSYAGSVGSNPNLLINGDFQVNQRGATSYSNGVYTVDRWKLHDGGSLTVNDGYVTFSGTALRQAIEMSNFVEQSYTLSVKYKDVGIKSFVFENYDGSYKEIKVDGFKCALQYSTNSNSLLVYLWNGDSDINVEYVKLEQGSVATPFIPRLYAEELALCQRYYTQIIKDCSLFYTYSSGKYIFQINTPSMRIPNPSITFNDIKWYTDSGFSDGTMESYAYRGMQENLGANTLYVVANGSALRSGSYACVINCTLDAEIY